MQYNKLIRDKIPDIIISKGEKPITRTLSDEEYLAELDKKLIEEVTEYQESKELEELADILEVIFAISEARGYSKDDLITAHQKKHNECGGFSEKIFLISKNNL